MKVPCPGCGTMLEVTDSGCQLCLRGRSKGEILRDIQKFKAAEKAARLRPWKILAAVALTAAAGHLSWTRREELSAAGAAARAKAEKILDEATDPRNHTSKPAPADLPPAPVTQASDQAPARASAASASSPTPAQAAIPGRTPAEPKTSSAPTWELPRLNTPAGQGEWLVRGFVYDLASVRPVPSAEISYRERTGASSPYMTTADLSGYYEIRLRKRSDYLVEVRAEGYRTAPLEESDPPYRAQSKATRAKALSEALGYTSDAALISWNENLDEVRQDLVLVPSR